MSNIITVRSLVSILLVSFIIILGGIKILSVIFPQNSAKVANINLIDHDGKQIPYSSLDDRQKLVFFGFTNCPSICPAALANISAALDIIGKDATKLHVMFITTDPKRDTPEVLKSYISNFNSNIVGYTGAHDELKKIYKQYYVYTQEAPPGKTEYDLNHSTTVYLIGKDGELVDHYEADADPEEMAKAVKEKL